MKTQILIIEDNTDIRESTAEILGLSGYQVIQAANGKEGVEIIQKQRPDLVLCDIMMPELDGYGVLHVLNKDPETAAIPFIFLTAKAERVDIRKGMDMGADDYLTKPFDDMELLVAVESRLNKKKQQETFYSKSLEKLGKLVSGKDGLSELKKTIAELRVRQVKKNQVIYNEGDIPPGVFLVLSGRFKTIRLADDGRELITGMYAADDYIGIDSALLDKPFSETGQAMEDGSYCLLPKDSVDQFLSRFTDIGKKFIQILSNNIREKEEQLLHMAYHSVRKRMSEVLLKLPNHQPGEHADEWLKITREELASMAGMATETVSRILSDFTSEKLIEKKGRLIRILDKKKSLGNEKLIIIMFPFDPTQNIDVFPCVVLQTMKVVAFSIKPFEKICLARANTKKHEITLISNSLSPETAIYAEGKEAVIVFTSDDVSEKVIGILDGYGIKYIITRSTATGHIDKVALDKCGIQLLNVKQYPHHSNTMENGLPVAFLSGEATQQIADQTIRNLDLIQRSCKM